jgi:hypothetical protein
MKITRKYLRRMIRDTLFEAVSAPPPWAEERRRTRPFSEWDVDIYGPMRTEDEAYKMRDGMGKLADTDHTYEISQRDDGWYVVEVEIN